MHVVADLSPLSCELEPLVSSGMSQGSVFRLGSGEFQGHFGSLSSLPYAKIISYIPCHKQTKQVSTCELLLNNMNTEHPPVQNKFTNKSYQINWFTAV